MAITDNAFTAAEVQAAVTANPALLAELKTGLQPLGHHAISKDDYTTFLETERTNIASAKTKEIYDKLDADVLSVSGLAKATPDEKTYDYVKRVLGDYKTNGTTAADKIKALEKQIADGNGDAAMKAQLEALKSEVNDYKTKKEPEWQQKLFAKDVEVQFQLGLRDVKLKADIPESLQKLAMDNAKAQLVTMAKADANGRLYFVDKDGKAILDGVNPASASFVLATLIPDLIDTGKQQPGGGSQPPAGPATQTGVKNADGKDIEIPGNIGSLQELHEFLCSQGLSQNSKEFKELYGKYSVGPDKKPLPLRKKVA